LKRRGFSPEALLTLKRAYRTIYKSGLMLDEARTRLQDEVKAHPEIQPLLDFLAVSKRGIIR
jgi:UDP-N-acetylglucosamine acyltransferase